MNTLFAFHVRGRFLLLLLLFISTAVKSETEIIYSTDFDDRGQVRDEWIFDGNIRFRTGEDRRESGRALRIARESSITLPFDIPPEARDLTVRFWMRVGHDDFSDSPDENAQLVFTWLNKTGGLEEVILHSGIEGAGDILRPSITIPAGQYQTPNGQISIFTVDAVGRYYVDSFFIDAQVGADGFSIEPGQLNASVCTPNSITISVLDSESNVISDFEGIVDISTSTSNGDWSMVAPNGRLSTGGPDSGVASYQFEASDLGQVDLLLSNEHAEALTIQVSERDGPTQLISQLINYAENAFVFSYQQDQGRDLIAYREHNITLSMVKKDEATGECGIAENYELDNVDLQLMLQGGDTMAPDPIWHIGGESFDAVASFQNLPVRFTAGVAQFQLLSRDVGRLLISARDSSNSFSSELIVGDSGEIISRPFALWLNTPNNPVALDHNGNIFTTAGAAFELQVSVVGWQPGDDLDSDGVADGHDDLDHLNRADLSDNPLLQSFSQEGDQESVQFSARFVNPDAALHGELSGDVVLAGFASGYAESDNIRYSNVGIIEIEARINGTSYLGTDIPTTDKIQGRSGAVGRFIPSHFSLSDTDVMPACAVGGFSHLNQDFTTFANISAVNTLGVVTDAYQDDFAKLDSDNKGSIEFKAEGLSERFIKRTETLQFQQGQAAYSSSLQLQRLEIPDGPWLDVQIGFGIQDDDGVEIDATALNLDLDSENGSENDHLLMGISDFYFSRLNLPDAHGPENRDLLSQLHIESWKGNSFQRSDADSCSQLLRSDIRYVQSGVLSVDSNRTVLIGAGSSTGTFQSIDQDRIDFIDGDAKQIFSAPGFGNRGVIDVDIDLASYPWLQFDWNQDGDHSDSALPRAHIQFGVGRGHDRVVYWRELYP